MRRRCFLQGLGASALLSPFVTPLGRAAAQASVGPAKYLCLMTTTGSNPVLWQPGGPLFNESNRALERVADDVILVSGLSGNGQCATHGSPGGLTGVGYSGFGHTSIDQFIAGRLAQAGVRSPIPSLVLGGDPGAQSSTFWRSGERVAPIKRPRAAFEAIFAGASAPQTGGPAAGEDDALRRRKSVIDLVRGELTSLRARLGVDERRKLELHLESLRALEQRLLGADAGGEASAGACQAPAGVVNGDQVLVDNALSLDLAVTALGCDLTRVVAVEFGFHNGTQVNLPGIRGGDWHSNYLHSNQVQELTQLEGWLTEQFVLAMEKAKRLPAPDGRGTLYDQTLFVWARTMGDAVVHNDQDMRTVFAGGAGGALRRQAGGRHVDAAGQSHQRALLSCAAAMGVEAFSEFGNTRLGGDSQLPLSEVMA